MDLTLIREQFETLREDHALIVLYRDDLQTRADQAIRDDVKSILLLGVMELNNVLEENARQLREFETFFESLPTQSNP